VIGLRNTVIHHYFGIDHATIWFVIKEQLPGAPHTGYPSHLSTI
jgi:uncharacterized protein with HEPN domain